MVIEFLKFRVIPEYREKFVEEDARIWTSFLSKQPGYLSKEVWLNPNISEEVIIVARWQTREQWKAIPQDILDKVEQEFAQALGENTYKMVESLEYQLRKFPLT